MNWISVRKECRYVSGRVYLCIDLKSFYASVECVERGLDPMTTNLVVADPERSTGTICLAVSPSMKALGVKNRCRVYEIPEGIDYIIAPPRMKKYIDYAADIYGTYLRYVSPDDIYVYSIDEAFLDITGYLKTYNMTPREMAIFLMGKVTEAVGVRATAGIGTNLYLAKIALDITAKHSPDFIGELDEESFKEKLWLHRPLTDFWRIGPGTARRLARLGIFDMRGIAMADESVLYKEFGIDAELMIDHSRGIEPVTIADIKAYRPRSKSLSSGQVLMRDYSFEEAKIIIKEMTDSLSLDMVDKGLVTSSLGLYIGYSSSISRKPSGGTVNLGAETNADSVMIPAILSLYESIADKKAPIRRINISTGELIDDPGFFQASFFDAETDGSELVKSRKVQEAVLKIQKKHGKNAILKGMDFEEAATRRERNGQIGGHKSGEQT
ncbi:MAG: DNA repair protein [Oscillospiraceae bacterium]|nr:DNA repair protein [Oscillospiraceae bacterium]